jgi:hypothetical protein
LNAHDALQEEMKADQMLNQIGASKVDKMAATKLPPDGEAIWRG